MTVALLGLNLLHDDADLFGFSAEPRDQWIAAQKEIDAILADRDTSKQQKILAINRLKDLPATVKQRAMQAAQTGKDFTI